MPRRVSSSTSARRIRFGSFCAHRVGNRLWSWLDAVQTGQAPVGQACLDLVDQAAEHLGLERRLEEREVEGQVQLVALAVEAGQAVHARTGTSRRAAAGAGRTPRRCVRQCRSTVVQLGPVGVEALDARCRSTSRRAGCRADRLSFTIMWATSMRNPATPRSNQKRRMRSNSSTHPVVPPVQVGLLGHEVVQEPLAGRGRRTSTPVRRTRCASCWVGRRPGRPGGIAVGPHVPVAVSCVAGTSGNPRTTGAGPRCGWGRCRERCGCRGDRPQPPARRGRPSVPSDGSTSQ